MYNVFQELHISAVWKACVLLHSVVVGASDDQYICVMEYVNYEIYKYRIYEDNNCITETVSTGAPGVNDPLDVAGDFAILDVLWDIPWDTDWDN